MLGSAAQPVPRPGVLALPLTVRHAWVAITVAAAFIGPASTPIALADGLWSLLRGAWMAEHAALLDGDPFTSAPHVAGATPNVQWLADLLLHYLDVVGGLPLVIAATALVVTLTYGLLLAAANAASGYLRSSCLAVWCAYALGATNLSARPQTLTYPLFALFVLAVVRPNGRLLGTLPLATLLWANMHGSFFVGLLLLGCAAVGRFIETRRLAATRAYLLTLGACGLATLVNPYGPGALVYVLSIGTNPVIRDFVTEWAPTSLADGAGVIFFASVVLIGVLVLLSRVRLSAVEIVTLLAFAALAWSSQRAIVWWGLALAPTLARMLGAALPAHRPTGRDRPLVNAGVVAGALLVAALSSPWTKSSLPILPPDKRMLFSSETPTGVGEYLKTHDPPPAGRMLNHQAWGGYFEWIAWPRHRVFVDGRIELHPTEVWLDYLLMVFPSAHWRGLFARYDISYAVLSRREEADLIDDLRAEPGWRVDYEDDQAIVLSRTAPPLAAP